MASNFKYSRSLEWSLKNGNVQTRLVFGDDLLKIGSMPSLFRGFNSAHTEKMGLPQIQTNNANFFEL
jgi:hypothetical protein